MVNQLGSQSALPVRESSLIFTSCGHILPPPTVQNLGSDRKVVAGIMLAATSPCKTSKLFPRTCQLFARKELGHLTGLRKMYFKEPLQPMFRTPVHLYYVHPINNYPQPLFFTCPAGGHGGVGSREVIRLQKQNLKLLEENNLLKYKVELLLDMLAASNADCLVLQRELDAIKKVQNQTPRKR